MALKKLGQGQAYLKAGFQGFQKSGKTYTAIDLAIGVRKYFELKGPIAMFDTESGSEYIAKKVKRETKKDLVGDKARALTTLMSMTNDCVREGASVLVVDSVTHIWRELCDSHLAQLNKIRKERNQKAKTRLDFQDWAVIKRKWADWTDLYLNAPIHIIICGRAGYEYDMEVNDEGKKELVKTGTKMKTEGEFGFEPSLLIEMEREVVHDKNGKRNIHVATVIGDRFNVIDGKTCIDPTYEFFMPHLRLLKPDAHTPIDTTLKSASDIDEGGNDDYVRYKRNIEICLEEIEGELHRKWPTQQAADKTAKVELIEKIFGTRSWTKLQSLNLDTLRDGLMDIRDVTRPIPENEKSTGGGHLLLPDDDGKDLRQ